MKLAQFALTKLQAQQFSPLPSNRDCVARPLVYFAMKTLLPFAASLIPREGGRELAQRVGQKGVGRAMI